MTKTRDAETTRARILDAAEQEFAAKGFDGARLGNIAREAAVQQALIHHYFADKRGLYVRVLERVLAAVAEEGRDILERLAPAGASGPRDLHPLVRAMVALLLRLYATHAPLMALLRHDADLAAQVVERLVKPVFDGVIEIIDRERDTGVIRADVDARHLCLSAMGLAAASFQEAALMRGLWTVDITSPSFLAEREEEIVRTLLARAGLEEHQAVSAVTRSDSPRARRRARPGPP